MLSYRLICPSSQSRRVDKAQNLASFLFQAGRSTQIRQVWVARPASNEPWRIRILEDAGQNVEKKYKAMPNNNIYMAINNMANGGKKLRLRTEPSNYIRTSFSGSADRLMHSLSCWLLVRKNAGSKCLGVDLNRNFPQGYGIGASKNPCSEVFQGEVTPSPFNSSGIFTI